MRHRKNSRKLSRKHSHRKAMLNNMARSLIIYQRIKTTLAKAKEARRLTERLISLSKRDTLHSRRLAYDVLRDRVLVAKLFKEIAPLFKDRNGGFTRIVRLNNRTGDGAGLVILELVEKLKKEEKPKKIKETREKKPEPAKELHKKEEKPREEKVKEIKKEEEKVKPKAEREEKKPQEPPKKAAQEVSEKREEPKKKPGFLEGIRKFFKK